jgi:ADP-ribose pyrophosphatase
VPAPADRPPGGWKRLRSRLLLARPPWLEVFADDVELPDGREVPGYLRVESREYATVFAVAANGAVLYLRQYKYGAGRVALQLPAGYLEADEAPEDGARRELLEETGYVASRWDYLGGFRPDGNRGFGVAHFFLARDAHQVQAPDAGDLEEATLCLLPLDEAEGLMSSGEMVELAPIACVALALARLRRDAIPRP